MTLSTAPTSTLPLDEADCGIATCSPYYTVHYTRSAISLGTTYTAPGSSAASLGTVYTAPDSLKMDVELAKLEYSKPNPLAPAYTTESPPLQSKHPYRQAWIICMACFMLTFVGMGPFYSSTTILAWYTDSGTLGSSEAALISSFFVFPALWEPCVGVLVKKLGVRTSTVIGVILLSLGQLASSFCVARPQLLWLTFGLISGEGASFILLVATSLPCLYVPPSRVGLVLGLVTSANAIGGCFFALVIQPALSHLGPAWTFRLLAGIILFLGIPSALCLKDKPAPSTLVVDIVRTQDDQMVDTATPSASRAALHKNLGRHFIDFLHMLLPTQLASCWSFRILMVATFILAFAVFYFSTFIGPICGSFGYSPRFGSWMIITFNICAIMSRFGLSLLCDYVDPMLVMACSLTVAGVAASATFAMAAHPAALGVASAAAGLSSGGVYTVLTITISQNYGASLALTGTAVVESLSAVGYLSGPFIAGYISDKTYDYAKLGNFNGGALWSGLMLLSSASLWLYLYLRTVRCRQNAPRT